MNDLLDALEAVRRRVHPGSADDAVAVAVVLERSYPAAPADIWDALTDPARLARWFLPVEGDLRAGGTFHAEGGTDGEILACAPPERLVVSWGAPDSVVAVTLVAHGDGTTLTLEHAVPAAHVPDAGGALYVGPGWDEALVSLALHLAGGTAGQPELYAYGAHTVRAWEGVLRASGLATPEQVAAAVELSWQQFATPPADGS